jgi:geranylgeranyl pyrophosphate synthase
MAGGSSTREPLEDRLARAGARIQPVLDELLPRDPADLLSEAIWYHLDTGGKRIRPAICLLTCEQFGGDPGDALYFAAAVELLHNMLLIHDDAEDGDTMRRDRETVWARFGMPNAINVGDYMLGVALNAVLASPVTDQKRVRLLRAFCEVVQDTCAGQALDLNWRGTQDMTIDDYLRLVTLKTGRYMAIGMVGGGVIAGLATRVLDDLAELGRCMGAAFQIRDDTIDLTLGKGRGGMVGNDIREGKSSILYARAVTVGTLEQKAELSAVMLKPRDQTTEADVQRVTGLYRDLGCFEFARTRADELIARAYEIIEGLPVADRGFFRELTAYMVSRNK